MLGSAVLCRRHILFNLLPVRRSRNESHVLLALPAPVSRLSQAYISQIFFERFNSPGLCLVEKPLLSSYAAGVLSSVIVDLGWEATSVVPVIDCAVQHSAAVQADVGARHCTLWLAHLLRQDASIVKALEALAAHRAGSTAGAGSVEERLQEALVALATQLVQDGHIRTPNEGDEASGGDDEGTLDVAAALVAGREKAVVEEQARRKAAMEAAAAAGNDEGAVAAITGEQGQAGGSTDASAVLVDFRGLKIKVGPSRFRYAEPLLDPSILASVRGLGEKEVGAKPFGAGPDPSERIDVMEPTSQNFATAISVPEAVSLAINACELERRPGLWENLVITGASTRVRGLGALLLSAMARFVASAPTEASQVAGEPNPLQAHNVRALRVPDYFAEFKERTDLAPFLGATIHAKVSKRPRIGSFD